MKKGTSFLLLFSLLLASSVSFAVDSGPPQTESTITPSVNAIDYTAPAAPTFSPIVNLEYKYSVVVLGEAELPSHTRTYPLGVCTSTTTHGFIPVVYRATLFWQSPLVNTLYTTTMIQPSFQYQICTATFYRC